MALLRWFCAQAFLLVALISGTCFAGVFRLDKDRASRSKLRIQTANKAANAYGSPACTPGSPQFPNYIQPMKIDPTRMMGKWYLYLSWFQGIPDTRATNNVVLTNTNLLNGSLTLYPGSNTKAIPLEQLWGSINVATSQCNTNRLTYLEYLTADGEQRGFGFLDEKATADTSLVLSTDYETYTVFFQCDKYNLKSGICADPYPLSIRLHARKDRQSISNHGQQYR